MLTRCVVCRWWSFQSLSNKYKAKKPDGSQPAPLWLRCELRTEMLNRCFHVTRAELSSLEIKCGLPAEGIPQITTAPRVLLVLFSYFYFLLFVSPHLTLPSLVLDIFAENWNLDRAWNAFYWFMGASSCARIARLIDWWLALTLGIDFLHICKSNSAEKKANWTSVEKPKHWEKVGSLLKIPEIQNDIIDRRQLAAII